jgi:hypothetical protein
MSSSRFLKKVPSNPIIGGSLCAFGSAIACKDVVRNVEHHEPLSDLAAMSRRCIEDQVGVHDDLGGVFHTAIGFPVQLGVVRDIVGF